MHTPSVTTHHEQHNTSLPQRHGLQELPLYLFWQGELGGKFRLVSQLCLKCLAGSLHDIEHVGQVELQSHLNVSGDTKDIWSQIGGVHRILGGEQML